MTNSSLIQQMRKRELITQITDEQALTKRLSSGPVSLYCGFDPTADSLHLGHILPLLWLKRFQLDGHRPIALIGGATGLIGDPSFKSNERILNTFESIQERVEKIKLQISNFLDLKKDINSAIILDNYNWFSKINVLSFLRDIGKHFSVNEMINKQAVKQRLYHNNSGISFTEFSYNLLQSYDFAFLSKKYDVVLQIGGSDQWGNITSGVNLTRKLHQKKVYGLTLPLITKENGTKFGKTETGTLWLDPGKTSPYKFYQFWINISDNEVYRFLKLFTFLPLSTIDFLKKEDFSRKEAPYARYVLAEEVTRLIHGEQALASAQRITTSLFTGKLADLRENDFDQLAQDGMPVVNLSYTTDLLQALVQAELVSSRNQARILINSNAVTVNGKKQVSPKYTFNDSDRLYGRYTLLRRGKKHYCLINWK